MKLRFAIFVLLLVPAAGELANAQEFHLLQEPGLTIRFEPQLLATAREVAEHYPRLRRELEHLFGWEITFRPTFFLIGDRQRFQHLAGNPSIVAYARPGDDVAVIDCSRLHIRPHRLDSVLKHEMIHLLLHRNIRSDLLPRWLDEGVAQQFSGGLAELLTAPHPSLLEEALLAQDLIPLADLNQEFPRDRKPLLLAYEQSRSFVAHIAANYGDPQIQGILNRLKSGSSVQQAFADSLNRSLDEVERQWIDQLRSRTSWYSYLALHIYDYLFPAAALLAVVGFFRFLARKRAYRDQEEE